MYVSTHISNVLSPATLDEHDTSDLRVRVCVRVCVGLCAYVSVQPMELPSPVQLSLDHLHCYIYITEISVFFYLNVKRVTSLYLLIVKMNSLSSLLLLWTS